MIKQLSIWAIIMVLITPLKAIEPTTVMPDSAKKVSTATVEEFEGHFTGITFAVNWYAAPGFKTSFPAEHSFLEQNIGKSLSFGINALQYSIGLQKHNNTVGLVTGAGCTVHNYRFNHGMQLIRDSIGNTTGLPRAERISKNKLTVSYVNIPLMLEIQFPRQNSENRWFLDIGAYCGFKVSSHTKMVNTDSGKKEKRRHDLNINPVQYGTILQFGTEDFKLFATYNFSPLFDKAKAPEVYPIQIGISLISF